MRAASFAAVTLACTVAACDVPQVDYLLTDAGASVVTLRDGVDGYAGTRDTFISGGMPTTSFGMLDMLQWTTTPDSSALIRFEEIQAAVPAGSVIEDAVLELNVIGNGSPSAMLYELATTWSETTTFNTLGPNPGVTTPEDRTGQQIGLVNGSAAGMTTIRVGASVVRWLQNPNANRGWVILPNDAGIVRVASRESTNVQIRPALRIVYTPPL